MGSQFSKQRRHNKVGNEKINGTCRGGGSGVKRVHSGGIGSTKFDTGEDVAVSVPDATRRQHKSKTKSFHTFSQVLFSKRTNSVSDDKLAIERLQREVKDLASHYEQIKFEKDALADEITRLRKENKALNAVLPTLRSAKDRAVDAEKDAMARATSLEQEKDKTQRQFKVYREAKEKEIQDILKKKQLITNKLRKFINTDGSVNGDALLDNTDVLHQCETISEWLLDNDSVSNAYLHEKVLGGSLAEKPAFIEMKTETEMYHSIQSMLQDLHHIEYGVPKDNMYLVYISYTDDMLEAVDQFHIQCRNLIYEYETEDRLLTFFGCPCHLDNVDDDYKSACEQLQQISNIFISFVGSHDSDSSVSRTIMRAVVDQPKQSIFVCVHEPVLEDIMLVERKHHVICGLNETDQLVRMCVATLSDVCRLFLCKQYEQSELERIRQIDNSCCNMNRDFPKWNILDMQRQACLQENIHDNTLRVTGMLNEMKILDEYVQQDGPVQPLLVCGKPGSGKSVLLAHWLQSMKKSLNLGCFCVLYHVASISCPDSRSVSHLLRRFIFLLVDRIPIAVDPMQLEKDFPKYLEQACNNYSDGVVVVIDGADIIENVSQLKWLLDPLPFSVRVIISVSSEDFPEKWKSWPFLYLGQGGGELFGLLQSKNSEIALGKHLHISAGDSASSLFEEVCRKVSVSMAHKPIVRENLSNHLFCSICAHFICHKSTSQAEETLKQCISQPTLTHLYSLMISSLFFYHNEKIVFQILCFLLVARNGVSMIELLELMTDVDAIHVYLVMKDLIRYHLVERVYGFYQLIRKQVQKAVRKTLNLTDKDQKPSHRKLFVEVLCRRFDSGFISCRLADELPWQLGHIEGGHVQMETCMSSCQVFMRLYQQGKHNHIRDYWSCLGKDVISSSRVYLDACRRMKEDKQSGEEQLSLVYDIIGEFTLDDGQYGLSHEALERSLDVKESCFDPGDWRIANTLVSLGRLFWQWRKFQTAEDYYNQVLEVAQEHGQTNSLPYAKCLEWLGILHQCTGSEEKTDSVTWCRQQAARIRHENEKRILMKVVHILHALRRSVSNVMVEEKALMEMKKLGDLYFNVCRYEEALAVLREVLEQFAHTYGPAHPRLAELRCTIGEVYEAMDEFEKAEAHIEKALMIFIEYKTDTNMTELAFLKFIKLLKKQGKTDKIEAWRKKISTKQTVDGSYSTNGNATLSGIGKLVHKLGQNLEIPSIH